jgi:hypothetical protein
MLVLALALVASSTSRSFIILITYIRPVYAYPLSLALSNYVNSPTITCRTHRRFPSSSGISIVSDDQPLT